MTRGRFDLHPCSNFKLCNCIGHMMKRVLGNIFATLNKDQDKRMYFLVNASPPKTLDVATSNFTGA